MLHETPTKWYSNYEYEYPTNTGLMEELEESIKKQKRNLSNMTEEQKIQYANQLEALETHIQEVTWWLIESRLIEPFNVYGSISRDEFYEQLTEKVKVVAGKCLMYANPKKVGVRRFVQLLENKGVESVLHFLGKQPEFNNSESPLCLFRIYAYADRLSASAYNARKDTLNFHRIEPKEGLKYGSISSERQKGSPEKGKVTHFSPQ